MKKLVYVLVFVNLLLGFFVVKNELNSKNIVYVDIQKVYSEFEMKKEYESKFKKTDALRKRMLDSLELNLKVLGQQIELGGQKDKNAIAKFQVDREDFFQKKQQFEEDNVALIKDYDEKILKQLNQFMEDFGKKNGYDFIFGYKGSGELLYSNAKFDQTANVITFINNNYKGIND